MSSDWNITFYITAHNINPILHAYIPCSGPWIFVWSSSESQSCRCRDHLSPSVSASLHQQQWMCQFGPHQHCERTTPNKQELHLKEESKCQESIYCSTYAILCNQLCTLYNHFTLSYTLLNLQGHVQQQLTIHIYTHWHSCP